MRPVRLAVDEMRYFAALAGERPLSWHSRIEARMLLNEAINILDLIVHRSEHVCAQSSARAITSTPRSCHRLMQFHMTIAPHSVTWSHG